VEVVISCSVSKASQALSEKSVANGAQVFLKVMAVMQARVDFSMAQAETRSRRALNSGQGLVDCGAGILCSLWHRLQL